MIDTGSFWLGAATGFFGLLGILIWAAIKHGAITTTMEVSKDGVKTKVKTDK